MKKKRTRIIEENIILTCILILEVASQMCKRTLKARTQEADTVLGEQILPWLTEVAPRTGSIQILVSVLGATW